MSDWLSAYRTDKTAVWIKVTLTDGSQHFMKDVSDWKELKKKCDSEHIFLFQWSLQFRSHEVHINLQDAVAAYMVKSVKGVMGGETTHFYVTGILKADGRVYKDWWHIPELVTDRNVIETLDECFEEMLIYDQRENGEK